MGSIGANRNTGRATAEETATRSNLGYNERRMANIENIRANSETRRIVEQERRDREAGPRNWTPTENQRITNVSYARAENELFNAPVGTVITMDRHNTGDYIGEYTRTANGWEGSQRYRSSFVKPANVTTPGGFAAHVVGNDIKVIQLGGRRRRR